MRAETAIETAQFGAALLLSAALHVPAYLFVAHLRDTSLSAPLRIEASIVTAKPPAAEEPQNAPLEPVHRAPPMISTQITTAPLAPAPVPHVPTPEPNTQDHAPSGAQPSGGGVRARLLSSLEPEADTASRNDFVVAPPVPGDENAPLPFATSPGPNSPAHPDQGAGGPGSGGDGSRTPRPDDGQRAVNTALAAYGRQLIERVMAQGRYPPEAIARGWQGKVLLLLRFGKRGALQDVTVRQSSGYAVLDSEAVEMAKRANVETPIPDILRERNFMVTIPVTFRLGTTLLDKSGNLPATKTD